MFEIGGNYTKNDIYRILNVPEDRQRGAWDKGLREYENEFFVFANIGIQGRTGHDYNNYWEGDLLYWEGATGSHIGQPTIQRLLSNQYTVFVFTRTYDKSPFTYEGTARVQSYRETIPVGIVWEFTNSNEIRNERLPEEVIQSDSLWEGVTRKIEVNVYERNPVARRICIEHYGPICQVCEFDFQRSYGDLGRGFIHVHHITPLSQILESYVINPINDLVPVCPNCHAMLHRKNPPIPIEELRSIMEKNNK